MNNQRLNEIEGKLIYAGATQLEKELKLVLKFQTNSARPELKEIPFIRNITSKESLEKTLEALKVMGLREERFSQINDLSIDELFNFNLVRCAEGVFRLVIDEVEFSNGEKEPRVKFINNIKGRELNRPTPTGEIEIFLNTLR